jgi:two-component sensor histidine kinase
VPVELLFPLLLWISARCRPAFTSAAVFIVSLTIVSAFIFGLGHFGDAGPSMEQRIFATQAAVLGVAIFAYVLAALFAERREHEERQKTLMSELQHRTNNLLAVVQTIANRTLSGGYPLKEANEILQARLRALARANKQLTESDWSGLTLVEIIKSELEPYLARCEIEGTDIVLCRQRAQNFSLVLHELATNAIKHGALSNLEGRVRITCATKGDGRDSRLIFHWREQGGPPVVAPKRQGFGSTLLRTAFADARSNFDMNGFSCEIEVPFRPTAPPTGRPSLKAAGV